MAGRLECFFSLGQFGTARTPHAKIPSNFWLIGSAFLVLQDQKLIEISLPRHWLYVSNVSFQYLCQPDLSQNMNGLVWQMMLSWEGVEEGRFSTSMNPAN